MGSTWSRPPASRRSPRMSAPRPSSSTSWPAAAIRRRPSPSLPRTHFACSTNRKPTAPVTTRSGGRTQVLELMGTLKLYGMRGAYDEVMATGIKRQHEPPRIVGDLLTAEISEKQARSIKYQLTVAKLPLAKDIEDFD